MYEWGKKREMNQCVCMWSPGVSKYVSVAILTADSAVQSMLCYAWAICGLFFYWVLYLFTKRLWEEYAHWIPLPFLFRMNKRFTLEILFGIGQYRAINHVHYKFLGTCWLVLLFQFCLFIQCIWYFCLACVCAISICWVMIGHFCSSFVFTQC